MDEPRDETMAAETAADEERQTRDGERRRRGRRRWIWGGIALLVIVGGALVVTGRAVQGDEAAAADADQGKPEKGDAKKEEKTPIPVEVAAVHSAEIASYITATANLVAEGEVKVLAEVEGKVARVAVEEGDTVRKGDVLALLDRVDAEIALEKARVRAENASSVYQRGQELAKDQLISREDLEKREMDDRLARQERAEAEWRLAKTEIRAPISGRISQRLTQVGQRVAPNAELFQITDFDPLIARIYLPEKDVLSLATGREVLLTLDAAPDVGFTGRIRQIAPVVDTATGTVKVTIEAVRPPAAVRPGSFVTARIVRERRPDALVLPKEAVLRELQQAHVFVAQGEGDTMTAARREVTLGLEEGGRVEALSGVHAGDRLIVAGQGALKDGSRIRVLDPHQES